MSRYEKCRLPVRIADFKYNLPKKRQENNLVLDGNYLRSDSELLIVA
jgi:hypothetical protein